MSNVSLPYKILSIEAMVAVSERLLNRPPDAPRLDDKEELTSSLIILGRAHRTLVTLTRKKGEVDRQVQGFTRRLGVLDTGHDGDSRLVHLGLGIAAEASEDPDRAEQFLDAQQTLHPTGLAVNQLSYLEQAGNAQRVAERVTPEIRALLASITVDGKSFDTFLDRWIATGLEIGEVHERRAALGTMTDSERVSAADLNSARNAWIRAMTAFVAALDTTDFTDEEKAGILANLRTAQLRAARSSKQPAAPVEEPVEG